MKNEIFIMLTPKKIFLFTGNDKTEARLKAAVKPFGVLLGRLVQILNEIANGKSTN